ncbi:hypothetical protein KBK19_00970 [Microvirga sp. STR05]|uniref:RHS repeat protein n=1 Tax=Hymenobacter duratus TaxID=2771356 RepID=A0ABR8JE34_9BACT|nr:hypothetical protein [Hymenobacter duratus]MBD2713597.1 hypothetical protein [Hymenobacter duratus]MBR7948499.1 hypothetical protein [Microvirga sp. STR05]
MRVWLFMFLLLTAAGVRSYAQLPDFQDSAAVRKAHLQTIHVRSYYPDEEDGHWVREQRTYRFARSGALVYSITPQTPEETSQSSTSAGWHDAVKDDMGHVLATRFYQDGKWYHTHHAVFTDCGQRIQEYDEYPADSTSPASFHATNFYSYDDWGNFTEQVTPGGSGSDHFSLGTRYLYFYNANRRLIAKLRLDDLIVPVELDSMYYDAAGNMTRRVSYNLRRGMTQLRDLRLLTFNSQHQLLTENSLWMSEVREYSRYDGDNRYTPRTGPEQPNLYGHHISYWRYRPDGQLLDATEYTAHNRPYLAAEALRAVTHPVDSLFRVTRYDNAPELWYRAQEIDKQRTTNRYNQRGHLAESIEAKNSRPDTVFLPADAQSRTRWQYTYYQ